MLAVDIVFGKKLFLKRSVLHLYSVQLFEVLIGQSCALVWITYCARRPPLDIVIRSCSIFKIGIILDWFSTTWDSCFFLGAELYFCKMTFSFPVISCWTLYLIDCHRGILWLWNAFWRSFISLFMAGVIQGLSDRCHFTVFEGNIRSMASKVWCKGDTRQLNHPHFKGSFTWYGVTYDCHPSVWDNLYAALFTTGFADKCYKLPLRAHVSITYVTRHGGLGLRLVSPYFHM